jgi:hypothetical protein
VSILALLAVSSIIVLFRCNISAAITVAVSVAVVVATAALVGRNERFCAFQPLCFVLFRVLFALLTVLCSLALIGPV